MTLTKSEDVKNGFEIVFGLLENSYPTESKHCLSK